LPRARSRGASSHPNGAREHSPSTEAPSRVTPYVVSPEVIQPNAHVVLDYVLKDHSGNVLDESTSDGGEPIVYVHGYGMLVPGLEAGLAGMHAGDEKEIVVPAVEGFGERDEDLIVEIDRAEFPEPSKVAIGEEFVAESPDGEEAVMRVVEVHSDYV